LMKAPAPVVALWIAQSPDDASYPPAMLQAASRLRAAGHTVEFALRAQRLEKQLEAARKAGSLATIVVEASGDVVTYRARAAAASHGGVPDVIVQSLDALSAWASSTLNRTDTIHE
jgi:histidyl-tRNA synthetase